MKFVFVDTAALIAIGDKGDRFHDLAIETENELKKSGATFGSDGQTAVIRLPDRDGMKS